MEATGLDCWLVDVGSANCLVPTGNRPLPEQMLTYIFVAIWYHLVTMIFAMAGYQFPY